MQMKFLLWWSALLFTSVGVAHGSPQPSDQFSSAQLVSDLRGTPGVPKADQQPSILYKQRHAEGYLAGAMDATEGNMWCRPATIKPGELEELVWMALQQHKKAASTQGAAKEVIGVLRSRFPCVRRKP